MDKKYKAYTDYLLEVNSHTNLTTITDPSEIELKHFKDSLTVLDYIQEGDKVLDLGAGAGFPGIPLRIEKDIDLTLIDSVNKKVNFMNEVIEILGLSNARAIHTRAEDFAKENREAFDVVVSRAVANMSTLSELCLPFVKVSGLFIALKGPKADEEVKAAANAAYAEYKAYLTKVRAKGEEYLALAKEKDLPVILLVGRPYHLDPEINHGIDTLICDLGAVVISEDAVSHLTEKFPTKVLNQWTYHARLYAAAKLVGEWNDARINLVQLVSFGCGVDAITTDEVRRILEEKNRIYTQIKIDEITNLGAVKIRLRSLFAALGLGKEAAQ